MIANSRMQILRFISIAFRLCLLLAALIMVPVTAAQAACEDGSVVLQVLGSSRRLESPRFMLGVGCTEVARDAAQRVRVTLNGQTSEGILRVREDPGVEGVLSSVR